jgi:Siphovirus Gp157
MLYSLDHLMEGSAFEQEYDKAIANGMHHKDAVELASKVVEELTPEKVLRYAVIFKNFTAEVAALRAEAIRLTERAEIKVNKAEALKARLQEKLPPDFVLERPQAVVKFRKAPPSVIVDHPEQLPDVYTRLVPESRLPDKGMILDALKANSQVPGARLSEPKFNVQIK